MQKGDKVWYHTYDDQTGEDLKIACVVMSTFYEPGDPIMGVNLRIESSSGLGSPIGGVDSQDCSPREAGVFY